VNIVAFVIGAVLFVGGVVMFGYSFDGTTFDPFLFAGGIIVVSASIAIPFHLLKRVDG